MCVAFTALTFLRIESLSEARSSILKRPRGTGSTSHQHMVVRKKHNSKNGLWTSKPLPPCMVQSLDPEEPVIKLEREMLPYIRHKISDSFYPPGTVRDFSPFASAWLKLPQDGLSANDQELSGLSLCEVCVKAKKAALELQKELAEYTQKRNESNLPGASVGIGLHYGDCS